MRKLVVVDSPQQWSIPAPGAEVVSARDYLTSPALASARRLRVFNLCRDYRYQARGYYVSLLAEARGHKVIPSVKTIQDLKTPTVVRIISEELEDLIQESLGAEEGPDFQFGIYFGESVRPELRRLSAQLYNLFQAPLLRARFTRGRRWAIRSARAIGAGDVPADEWSFLQDAATRYFQRELYAPRPTTEYPFDLAILVDPEEANPPSDEDAIELFVDAAEDLGFSVELITREDASRIGEFDALLIRETTAVNHHTYRMARRAQSEGLAVIDDPDSILHCTNKVFLAEAMRGAGVPTPATLVVHQDNVGEVAATLGLPCVLKLPDSSFSVGVVKVETTAELEEELERILQASELAVAQRYTPTPFDWRIGILRGEPLFACKYYMAGEHWQIYDWAQERDADREGGWETVGLDAVPTAVLDVALRGAAAIGDGLYGVDLKETSEGVLLIEINDNPNIDAGVEDEVAGKALYRQVIRALRDRVERRTAPRGGLGG